MPRTQRERRELRAILPTIQSDRSDQHGHSGTRSPVPAVVVLAFAAWAGCAIGSTLASAGQPVLDRLDTALLMAGGATAAIGLHATRRRRGAAPVPLAITGVAIAVLGGGWSVLRMESDRHAIEAIAASCASERTLVRFEGIVSTPVRGSSPGDRLHAFFRRPPRATFEVDLVSIGPADRAWSRAVAGRVKVSLQDGAASWQVGDLVAATGWLVLERPEANPGQRPPMRASLEPMRLGLIEVPSAGLVEVDERTPSFVRDPWRSLDRIRFAWRHRSRALLESMLGSPEDRRSVDLLRAILLGDRGGEGYRDLRPGFAASGLAHFLAISGFNLAVITVLASIAARALGVRPRRRGLAMIVAIALYILAIPAQLPVLRAGLSALLLAIGLLLARRWDGRAATALAALALLALAPGESIEPGFQLSFAAVFALQELSPRLRRRWFGEPDHLGRSTRSILGSRAADAVSACVAAWAVSTPIALHHFGMAALLGVPATLLATPIVAATVSLAAVAMPIASIAPGTSPISGSILLALGDALLAVADAVAAVPHASWRTSPPAAAATLIVLSASICWLAARRRRASFAACAAVGAIMAIALPPPAPADTIEVTMLSVGDGTAIIVRRGHRAALIDVGSVGDRRAGGTIAIRAIESLGIRTLDAVLTSHPNLDHYSGLVEVLAQHREARWFVGEAFVQAATSRPDGPEAAALRTADRLGRVPGIISAGDQIELGGLVVGCLHPPPGESFDTANDASLVLRIDGYEPGDGTGSCRPILLTTGDLEEAGLARASMAIDALDPWVAEVPHHGSATRATARLVVSKPRTVWLQSTGRRRLEPDTLADLLSEAKGAADLPEVRRFVTARDGAISARFAPERGPCESRGWRLESLAVHSGRWIAISEPARSGSATRAGADPAPDRAAPREAR
jgi:competence protein ComEC